MKIIIFYFALICCPVTLVLAQTSVEIDSKNILDKAVELHDAEKYEEAIKEFQKVNSNDTNFVLACVELANSYIANKQDSLAIIVCDKASVLPSAYSPTILLYKANALDNLKKSDEAIKLYQEGIQKYPLNNLFYYELAVLKFIQKKYKEAHDFTVQSINCNPYHASSHHLMAKLAIVQGKLVPAMLAWQYYLLVDNSSIRANGVVTELEKLAKIEYEFKDAVTIDELSEQDDFSEVEALLKSKVALSNKYKSKLNINFSLNKQLQLIFEKLVVVKSDKGFYMQFYAPIVEAMSKKDFFEPYAYAILSGVKNKEVDAWVKKHDSEIAEFSKWFLTYMGETVCTYPTLVNGKQVTVRHWYKNNKIQAIGNQNEQGVNFGYWNFYYSNGINRSEGAFDNMGKRIQSWKFYYKSGLLQDMENYKDGAVAGIAEEYFTNGSIKTQKNYVSGQLDGLQTVYYSTGGKEKTLQFKAGKQNGKESYYYPNGQLKYEIQVTDGLYEGNFVQYFNNGHIMEKSSFKEGKRVGLFTAYYNFPENTIRSTVNYDKGTPTGAYKSLYRDGKIDEEGTYDKESEKEGSWKNYFKNGTMSSNELFSKGKSDGLSIYYDDNGKLTEEFTFKADILQEYKAYDATGKIIYQNKKDGKNNYDATFYYSNGNKIREGKVLGGQLVDQWKFYNRNGYITSLDNYVKGKKDGKSVTYYDTGKIKAETDYLKGETDGYYREYYKNGKLKMEGAYIQDNEVGEWKSYYADGNLSAINFYNDGSNDGWQRYYAVNGKLNRENFYELGYVKKLVFYDSTGIVVQEIILDKGTGNIERKYANGTTRSKMIFANDWKQGPYIENYPDGKPYITETYKNNKLEGEFKLYYPNGKLEWTRTYENGDEKGKHIQYYQDGTVKQESNYLNGDQHGKNFMYNSDKSLKREYEYKNGQLNGRSIIYAPTGELIADRTFKDGYLLSYTYMGKNGEMIAPIDIKNETATVKCYYKSGAVSMEYTLKNGALEGKRLVYNTNGKLLEEDTYVGDELQGLSKEYYANGTVKSEVNYAYDERNGKCISYYENGKLSSEEYYRNDSRHGICKYYDSNGKLTNTFTYYDNDILDAK